MKGVNYRTVVLNVNIRSPDITVFSSIIILMGQKDTREAKSLCISQGHAVHNRTYFMKGSQETLSLSELDFIARLRNLPDDLQQIVLTCMVIGSAAPLTFLIDEFRLCQQFSRKPFLSPTFGKNRLALGVTEVA